MKYQQGDIIEVYFMLPDYKYKVHPAIIVSNEELNEKENFYYIVLVSSKIHFPEYSYRLTDEMTTNKFTKESYVKCQVMYYEKERGVIRKLGKVRQPYLDEIIEKIITSIF
ncbi:MAG: type II toxin-antitoxin system PemK/MazF family toxin [Bacteroidales bacterium]|jgi:mRNA-degrading endonuclease toxin of MazEF toxin-antitoxin module|nr:type II toxin-antitoxin system PemK/MazF family toxin [Bacteroidales bacterium]